MTAERESMTLQEIDAPALGVEERRDEAPGAGASHARPTPDPEVVAKPKRRKFTAQYRLRILEEAESCTQPGEVGRLLRREGRAHVRGVGDFGGHRRVAVHCLPPFRNGPGYSNEGWRAHKALPRRGAPETTALRAHARSRVMHALLPGDILRLLTSR